jgi:hypothetical protein
MSKMSIFAKATVFAILIALLVASFPVTSVMAKGNNQGLEDKWSELVDNYYRQTSNHNSAHKSADHWLKTHKKASDATQADVERHLAICNSSIMAAGAVVSKHAGFDTKGEVIDRGAAVKSIKDLSYYLRQHAGSIKNLNEHIN